MKITFRFIKLEPAWGVFSNKSEQISVWPFLLFFPPLSQVCHQFTSVYSAFIENVTKSGYHPTTFFT